MPFAELPHPMPQMELSQGLVVCGAIYTPVDDRTAIVLER
jgi:hypothetical protein